MKNVDIDHKSLKASVKRKSFKKVDNDEVMHKKIIFTSTKKSKISVWVLTHISLIKSRL